MTLSPDLEMFSESANRIWGSGGIPRRGAGSAEPQDGSMPGVSVEQQWDQGGWRQQEREGKNGKIGRGQGKRGDQEGPGNAGKTLNFTPGEAGAILTGLESRGERMCLTLLGWWRLLC